MVKDFSLKRFIYLKELQTKRERKRGIFCVWVQFSNGLNSRNWPRSMPGLLLGLPQVWHGPVHLDIFQTH